MMVTSTMTRDDDDEKVLLLRPHLHHLLTLFQERLTTRSALLKDRSRKRVLFALDQRVLGILSRVSNHATRTSTSDTDGSDGGMDSATCSKLVALLVPYLREAHRLRDDAKRDILDTMTSLAPFLEDASPHLTMLFMLLLPGRRALDGTVRVSLVKLLATLGKQSNTSWLAHPSKLLIGLNAWSTKRVDEFDYEERLKACDAFKKTFTTMQSYPHKQLHVVVYQLIHTLHEDDFALRRSALDAIESLVNYIAKNAQQGKGLSRPTDIQEGGNVQFLETVLMPAIKAGVRSNNIATRKTFVLLLSAIGEAFEWMNMDERPLLHLDVRLLRNKTDEEADILHGLTHLQLHRRAKSLRRFRAHHTDGNAENILRPGTLAHIFLPLVTHILYETEKSSDYVIVDEAISTIASITAHLPWSRYYSVLRLLLVQLQRRPEKEKVLIKAVCASIESFHFDCSEGAGEESSSTKEVKKKKSEIGDVEDVEEEDEEVLQAIAAKEADENSQEEAKSIKEIVKTTAASATNRITRTLLDKLLPTLYQYLIQGRNVKDEVNSGRKRGAVNNKDAQLRVPIALAIVHVLQRLPKELVEGELERILGRMCKLLANRDQDVRDTTRKTLVEITKKLGVEYVHVVLRQMKLALHSGFMVHVLSYSVHAVFRAMYGENKTVNRRDDDVEIELLNDEENNEDDKEDMAEDDMAEEDMAEDDMEEEDMEEDEEVTATDEVVKTTPSAIDLHLTNIIPILDDDIFGRVAQQRQSEDYRPKSALSEAKTCKSYDTFEILARSITFLPCLSIHVA